ncbi:MAG TPA: glutamine synthetase III [Miltoncostaeaceae bacterium]|jgi:glutamine synthetase|nr:glutamine synthetase III [Miltoncostaeaceae bacterium]
MARIRTANAAAAEWTPDVNGNGNGTPKSRDLTANGGPQFGADVFGPQEQRRRLPKDVYRALERTVDKSEELDPSIADAVASAMKEWALENGATHYTHWFQPLTNSTAEKHDSFFSPVGDGTALATFSGKELIRGEPDASSFPTGGIRATFEARGYTAWDPTSPAFLQRNPNGTTLCIPTAFTSWTGEALDHKIPLLRSMEALNKSALRALRLFGDSATTRVTTTMGPEQEYFLVDKSFYYQRPDLVNTGRTLFGAKPPKGHELDDHYFGTIPERVLAYMLETESQLMRLGVPIKTRHNEVAPGQYEIAPVFETTNLGCDHQQLLMTVLRNVAPKYGLVCLLHEKPFAGVNGSGKHNNWSMGTDLGQNLLEPGETPHDNLQFLFFAAAVIKAVDTHQGLLRASVATAGQDHRLGANEAPPAIISIFLGELLERIFAGMAKGEIYVSPAGQFMGLGSPVLPNLPKDSGDRNRTSPFAFTGNKFEFRALGSSMSPTFPNTVLNTIVAEAVDALSEDLENAVQSGKGVDEAVSDIIGKAYREHSRIVFAGDGYSEEWHAEAERRGLLNLRTTPDALPEIVADRTASTFSNYGVLDERELHARYDVLLEQYIAHVNIEAETAADIARTMLLPAALRYLEIIDDSGIESLMDDVKPLVEEFVGAINRLVEVNEVHPDGGMEEALYMRDTVIPAMAEVRRIADRLERIVADDLWPLPKYAEILFIR